MKIKESRISVFKLIGLLLFMPIMTVSVASAQVVPVPPDMNAELYVQDNVNVTGARAPFLDSNGELIYRNGQLARQENEPSCGINPLNKLNILCAFNWYGFADTLDQGDAWIGFSETIDGRTFKRRPLTGTKFNYPIGREFAADPTVLVFPGGAIVTFIVGDRAGNSYMVAQRMMDVNREYGFKHVSEAGLIIIESLEGVHFIDKPDAQILIDPNGGTMPVTMTLEEPVDHDNDPLTPPQTQITREWPKFRVVVSFADFGGSGQNIRTWSTYSDNFGAAGSWSNKRQISNTSGLDQGLSIENKGDDLLYVWRRFDSGEGRASIVGALSNNRGDRIGKVFEITDICEFDQFTAPSADNPNRASVRTNDFPWLSATNTHFVLAYTERPRAGNGECLPDYTNVANTRVMIRTSANGTKWSNPVPVTLFDSGLKHFDFMPTIACGRGSCNVVYYSTLTESETFDSLVGNSDRSWENTGYIEDFNVGNQLWYRRFLDIYSSKITIDAAGQTGMPALSEFPERVSRYQIDFDEEGEAYEKEWSPANILNYGGNTVPFIGDYIALAIEEWRKDNGVWVDNASPVSGAINQPSYFAAWTDNRRVRVFYHTDGSPLDYVVPNGTVIVENGEDATDGDLAQKPEQVYVAERSKITEPVEPVAERTVSEKRPDRFLSAYAMKADTVGDDNQSVGVCFPVPDENAPVQTRIKDSEIYGATIEDFSGLENQVRLVSPAAAKNYLNPDEVVIQRGFVIGAQNMDRDEPRPLALLIEDHPGVDRASWRQLPFEPDDFASVPETLQENVLAEPLSTEYVTLFVVSEENKPVTVSAYDYDPDTGDIGDLVSQITVNGQSEAGDLQDPGTTTEPVQSSEIHNPFLLEPDWELEVFALNPNYKNPNFKNPNFKNPNYKNPNWKNTDYMDPNYKNPNFKNPNFKNTTELAPNLKNPNLKNPNLKNTTEADGFVDVTYGIMSHNNTTTATNADFGYGGDELDDLDVEVIAWQSDELDSLQNCDPQVDPDMDPAVITENKVIAAKSLAPNFKNPNFKNPNFKNLAPADINDPFQGFVSFPLAPAGTVNVTVRIFCDSEAVFDPDTGEVITPAQMPPEVVGSCEDLTYKAPNPDYDPDDESCSSEDPDPQICDPGLPSKLQAKLGYNFWAQKANTGQYEISNGREQLINDVIPPQLENVPNVTPVEATSSSGAMVSFTNPTATDSSGIADPPGVVCTPASGSTFPLGTTPVTCTATDLAEPSNTGTVSFDVTVQDTTAPDFGSQPPDIEGVSATSSLGADVTYTVPVATDVVDGNISGDCVPPSGSNFGIGTTTVTCDAVDSAGIKSTVTFDVTVVDLTAPVFNSEPPDVGPIEATSSSGAVVTYTAPTADDAVDGTVSADCSPDSGTVFALGDTTVSCAATDGAGNTSSSTMFVVSVVDTTAPSLSGVPEDISVEASSPDGEVVTYTPPTATDLVDSSVSVTCSPLSGSTFAVGDTTVTCTATDSTGNASEPATFVVSVTEFKYGITGITTTKPNAKTGTSIPTYFAWTLDGVPTNVSGGSQTMTVYRHANIDPATSECVGGEIVQNPDPGSSGFNMQTDFSWKFNFQANGYDGNPLPVDGASETYCLTVTLTNGVVAAQPQSGYVNLKPSNK